MDSDKQITKLQQTETVAVLALFFMLIGSFASRQYLLNIGISLLTITLFVKPIARIIAKWWLSFAEVLNRINSKLILTVVFYLLLTPIAILYRVFNRNCLNMKSTPKYKSLYIIRDHTFTPSDLEKMW